MQQRGALLKARQHSIAYYDVVGGTNDDDAGNNGTEFWRL